MIPKNNKLKGFFKTDSNFSNYFIIELIKVLIVQ